MPGFQQCSRLFPQHLGSMFVLRLGALGYTVLSEHPQLPDFGEGTKSTLLLPGNSAGILWDAFSKEQTWAKDRVANLEGSQPLKTQAQAVLLASPCVPWQPLLTLEVCG